MVTVAPHARLAESREDDAYLHALSGMDPSVGHLSGELAVPPYAFAPDAWSFHLLQALVAEDLGGQRVLEVGVGTGFVALCLLRSQPLIARLYGADLDARLPELAGRNAARVLDAEGLSRFVPCPGSNNLLTWFSDAGLDRPELVYGCVPQVPLPLGTQLDSRDNAANYYPAEEFPSRYNRLGLGLNDHLLRQARDVLAPRGRIVLNLAGRVRLNTLQELFMRRGYRPRVLRQTEVTQHPDTSLEPYALVEEETADTPDPVRFRFFVEDDGAREGRRLVDARTAESLRQAGEPCYHLLYAIEGVPYWMPKPAVA